MKSDLGVLTLALYLAAANPVHAELEVREQPAPGGVAVIPLPDAPDGASIDVRYADDPVLVARANDELKAWVGIPLDAEPGDHRIHINGTAEEPHEIPFTVEDREYESQHITIDDENMVTPDQQTLERIRAEQSEIRGALRTYRRETEPATRLQAPVAGPFSSPFGLRRFINDQPRNPHSGLDIAADEGTPVQAPADGRVVAVGEYYFNGRTVILEHGRGLVTMHAHLKDVAVGEDETVQGGDQIGSVGATGRATGPHLHWGVYLNGTAVDPELFLID